MTLLPSDICLIAQRGPGWEEAWGRLCVILLGDDGKSGELVRAVEGLAIHWPSLADRDDFISHVLQNYHERAVNGTLFISYDAGVGGPIPFLLSRRVLYNEALRFCHSLHISRTVYLDQFDGALEPTAPPPPVSEAPEFRVIFNELCGELKRMTLQVPKRITRVVEQAGLQLYPRLDWSAPGLDRLCRHLRQKVRPGAAGGNGLDQLARMHQARAAAFAAEIRALSEQLFNQGKPLPVRKRKRLERRYAQASYRRVFLPLTPEIVMSLLAISKGAAEMYRSRYRRALPDLLPTLDEYYHYLQSLRDEDEQDRREGGNDGQTA